MMLLGALLGYRRILILDKLDCFLEYHGLNISNQRVVRACDDANFSCNGSLEIFAWKIRASIADLASVALPHVWLVHSPEVVHAIQFTCVAKLASSEARWKTLTSHLTKVSVHLILLAFLLVESFLLKTRSFLCLKYCKVRPPKGILMVICIASKSV